MMFHLVVPSVLFGVLTLAGGILILIFPQNLKLYRSWLFGHHWFGSDYKWIIRSLL